MYFFHLTLLLTLGLFITACGEEKESRTTVVQGVTNSTSDLSENNIDAGEDRYVKINEIVEINAVKIPNSENVSSFLWKYKTNTLSTIRSFSYTPTNLGLHVLEFSVLYNDGLKISDTLNIIVTSIDINTTIPAISEALKMEYLKAVNNARTKPQDCGTKGSLPATTSLKWNEKLYNAAYEHMQDLIESQTFAHAGSGTESDWTGYVLDKKSDLRDRAEAYEYNWSRLGENLGAGSNLNQSEEMIQGWLESDSHCENLMNPNFTEVGMVMIKSEGSLYTHYWGQEFGTPR